MKILELKKDLHWIGALDPELQVFDIIVRTEYGTTYNSYLLRGSEKNVLFETVKLPFLESYLKTISELIDLKDIDYIVLNHTEPDHAGSVEKILELNPNITIVASTAGTNFLKSIVNRDFKSIVVKDNSKLSLGDKTLSFYIVPNLHWPDTMFTYLIEDEILFTCDAFGAHYCHNDILRSNVSEKDEENYQSAVKFYFDSIMAPFKSPYIVNALKKIEGLPIKMIATGHGPVIDEKIDEAIGKYKEWVEDVNPNTKKTVVMPYVSAYGYTKELGEAIKKGITLSGDIDVLFLDMEKEDPNVVLSKMQYADGVLFGTPTFVGEALKPIWDLTTSMLASTYRGKLGSAFGSYGWSGEGVPNIVERLKQVKMNVLEGYRVKFKASPVEIEDAIAYGKRFGEAILEKQN